jgi:hypothetical protein
MVFKFKYVYDQSNSPPIPSPSYYSLGYSFFFGYYFFFGAYLAASLATVFAGPDAATVDPPPILAEP